jgi:hypothetical protein
MPNIADSVAERVGFELSGDFVADQYALQAGFELFRWDGRDSQFLTRQC